MTRLELLSHLVGFGYPHAAFSVLGVGTARNEGFVLEECFESKLRISYYERGSFSYEVEVLDQESEACRRYLEHVKRVRVVLVMSLNLRFVERVRESLANLGVDASIHEVPPSVFGAAKYQLVLSSEHYGESLRLVLFEGMGALLEPCRSSAEKDAL
jgi:hypothetical protein